jgi:hypothetical protein
MGLIHINGLWPLWFNMIARLRQLLTASASTYIRDIYTKQRSGYQIWRRTYLDSDASHVFSDVVYDGKIPSSLIASLSD